MSAKIPYNEAIAGVRIGRVDGKFVVFPTYEELKKRLVQSGCDRCSLKEGRTQIVADRGNHDASIMVIGEGPGEILQRGLPHPPLTFFWTVQEEGGLQGARLASLRPLGKPRLAFNFDGTLWGSGAWANDTDWAGDGTIDTGTVNLWGDPDFVDVRQDELLADVDDGLLVQQMQGLHSGVNPISGDFSTGATGLLISNGTVGAPVREITIASTLQRMLLDIVEVGGDIEWLPMRSAGMSLVIRDVTMSGS
mgnify:CR=1 FL=1